MDVHQSPSNLLHGCSGICWAHVLLASSSPCSIVASYDVLVLLDAEGYALQLRIALQLDLQRSAVSDTGIAATDNGTQDAITSYWRT